MARHRWSSLSWRRRGGGATTARAHLWRFLCVCGLSWSLPTVVVPGDDAGVEPVDFVATLFQQTEGLWAFAAEWNAFAVAWADFRDWRHPAVIASAVALWTLIRDVADHERKLIQEIASAVIAGIVLNSGNIVELNQRSNLLEFMHGLCILELVLARETARCEFRPTGGCDHNLLSADDMRSRLSWSIVDNIFSMGEYTSWGVGYMDILALLGPSKDWPLEDLPLEDAFGLFKARGRRQGWLPLPPDPTLSAWPSRGWTRKGGGWTGLPAASHVGSSRALRAALFISHQSDHQQCLTAIVHAAREHLGWQVVSRPYILRPWVIGNATFDSFVGRKLPPRGYREYEDAMGCFTLAEAEAWALRLAYRDRFIFNADLVACGTPFWPCVVVQRLFPSSAFLVQMNMALLDRFKMWDDIGRFWALLVNFLRLPTVAFAVTHRLLAEQVMSQIGTRPEYVPYVSLYVDVPHHATHGPALFWVSAHLAIPYLGELLLSMGAPVVLHSELRKREGPLSFSDMASRFPAGVLFPHVPNPIGLLDAYAMGMPLFVPDEPYIYRFLWHFSTSYAGPTAPPGTRSRAPLRARSLMAEVQPESAPPMYDPYDFLEDHVVDGKLHKLAYWYQFTEFAFLPGLQRFRTLPDLVEQLRSLSEEVIGSIRTVMGHAARVRREGTLAWYAKALSLTVGGGARSACSTD